MKKDILKKAKDLEWKIEILKSIEKDWRIRATFIGLDFCSRRDYGGYKEPIDIPSELNEDIISVIKKWREKFEKELTEL